MQLANQPTLRCEPAIQVLCMALKTTSRTLDEHRGQRLLPRLSKDHAQKVCLQRIMNGEEVAIDYSKLLQFCRRREGERSLSVDHDQFMRDYLHLFKPCLSTREDNKRKRSTSAYQTNTGELPLIHSKFQTAEERMKVTTGTDKAIDEDLGLKLKAINSIALIHPPFRSRAEIKKLGKLLYHFPGLLPTTICAAVREGIASRAFTESFKDRHSYALPSEGGVYLILSGVVQLIDRDTKTGRVTTTILRAGKHFGTLQDPLHPPKHCYPLYWTRDRCILLRITATDYSKSFESYKEAQFKERLELLNSSPLLRTLPPDIRQKLARSIDWHTYPLGTEMLREGKPVDKISIIHRGQCSVHKKVPTQLGQNTSHTTQVCIKELGKGSCIGELAIEGSQTAPYSIKTSSVVRVGQIAVTDLAVLDVANNLSPAKRYSITIPKQDELRSLHASKLMSEQWTSLKKSILTTVYKETGRETMK